jgi:hypothetical protein
MEKKINSWEKPQLIVLGRSKPEEGVLAACKTNNYGTGPGSGEKHCFKWPDNCSSTAAS